MRSWRNFSDIIYVKNCTATLILSMESPLCSLMTRSAIHTCIHGVPVLKLGSFMYIFPLFVSDIHNHNIPVLNQSFCVFSFVE